LTLHLFESAPFGTFRESVSIPRSGGTFFGGEDGGFMDLGSMDSFVNKKNIPKLAPHETTRFLFKEISLIYKTKHVFRLERRHETI